MRQRVKNWDIALVQYARSIVGQPFIWGQTDCACVVLKCLDAIYGTDAASEVVGCYSSPESAYRQQERGDGLVDILMRQGAERVGCACSAGRGDILIGKRDRFICGHVVLGKDCISSDPDHGVVMVPSAEVMRCHHITAWRM